MKLRPYLDSDHDNIIALWTDCGLVVPQNNPSKDIARKLKTGRDLFLVGESEDSIVGSVMGGYDGHRGWINYLAVSPSVQGLGYGRMLMESIEAILREKGCPKINLQVRNTNTQVIEFYKAIGFLDDNVVSLGKRLEFDN
ncbi:GNAT family acetyltransferase [Reinekea forsetii]|nr:GNAT family acetyltransferase [Reinekea forsetii]